MLIHVVSFGQEKNNPIRVFFLGGQSNMEGFGYTKEVPDSIANSLNDVWIFHGNPAGDNENNGGLGKWAKLKSGHGIGFTTDGSNNQLSDRFGVELSFAKKISQLYPNEKIALIKYARNGSSLDSLSARKWGSWEVDYKSKTGINQYDHFLTTIKNAFKTNDIDRDGIVDEIIVSGIVWMQGESDAHFKESSSRYYSNLKRFMNLASATFRKDDLPIVIGKISDSGDNELGKVWKYGELVQYAQEKYAAHNDNVSIVRSTKHYKYSDKYHYDSAGYIDLGEKFAEALYKLLNK